MIKKSLAFTLAEVLLTMTIIGVVAAMTIPTLHYQRVKKEYTVKLKNFYSKMQNAVLDMENDYGSFQDLKKPTAGKGYDWYMKYVDPYVGHQYVKNSSVYFKDGSRLSEFSTGGCIDVVYDVNGDKTPNRAGYDRFRFLFCFDTGKIGADGLCDMNNSTSGRCHWFGNKGDFFGVYGAGIVAPNTSRQAMINKCRNEPWYCSRLLQNDQWEFKQDYPFKF